MKLTLITERLIIAGGIILSIFISLTTLKYEIEKDHLFFESRANKVFNQIKEAFENVGRINREFNSLFYLLDEVSEDEFRLLAGSLLRQNRFIELVYFAEKVPLKNKSEYEKAMQEEGYTGFSITQLNESVNKTAAPEHEFLFPVKYIEPFNVKNSRWFGRDLLTFSVVQHAIQALPENPELLLFMPAEKEKKRLFAVQILFNGYSDNIGNRGLNDVFGILLYKINMFKIQAVMGTPDFFSTVQITLDDNLILPAKAAVADSIWLTKFEVEKSISLGKQRLSIQLTQNKSLLELNLMMPLIVLIAGLFITLFIWHIIRAHIEHNRLLAEQKKIIEDEVNTKTRELSQKTNELSNAYNQQLALTEELEAFSYSVSHDLRAPLRALDGFSRALEEDYHALLDDNAQDYLQRICKASQRMATLIDALLSLSRITRQDLLLQHFSVSELVTEIMSNLYTEFPQRDIEVVIADKMEITADKTLMYIVFENLIRNAWKYTKNEANPTIEIGEALQDGQKVFFVKDNGVGFEMAFADRLFGSFQRLHHQRDFEGEGIGLATAKRIIMRHHGKIWATAEVNKGATFYFTVAPLAAKS